TARMAQDFSYRYPLVDGHGNWGSIDGDEPAAMRYTECRMQKIAEEMLKDIEKDTVPFQDNYDATEREPLYLPSAFPNLLANGAVGIAVGMATNIPPHNISELADGYIAYMENPEITNEELMKYIKGPDFPTGGIILGARGIKDAYTTGRGVIQVRAKADIKELANGKKEIIVKEIPYAVNKTLLIERIADIVKEKPLPGQEKKLDGIVDLRDESTREGIKIVIECRKDSSPEIILNNLYKYTQLQSSFSIIMLALVDNQPELLTLTRAMQVYFDHQRSVLLNRTKYDLEKSNQRKLILEGYLTAVDNIEELIEIIRHTEDNLEGVVSERFNLTQEQTKAILALPLRRLSVLEFDKIKEELNNVIANIEEDHKILSDVEEQHKILKAQMLDIKERYGDDRKTEIDYYTDADIDNEDLIPQEDVIVTITESGYIKRMRPDEYRAQNRGGRGKTGIKVHSDDVVRAAIFTSTHDYLLFITNFGRIYKLKTYRVPLGSRTSKGMPIVNMMTLQDGEALTAITSTHDFDKGFLCFVTKYGVIKRTPLSEFLNIRTTGIRALNLRDGDLLHNAFLTDGESDIIVGASNGKAIRFKETDARDMGRSATGVRAIELADGEEVVGVAVSNNDNDQILVVTEYGYGKRTSVGEYRCQARGGKGVKTLEITEKRGKLAKLLSVTGDEDLFVITDRGMTIRTPIEQIAQSGRATQGVRIINLLDNQKVMTVTVLPHEDEDEEIIEEDINEEEVTAEAKPENDKSDELF
nr:DNA gyrase subunit A [Gammaproteobacteria bacterium]